MQGEDGAEYALKIPLADGMDDYGRERAALLRLGGLHADADDWLVTVVDEGTMSDGRPFLVMPWFPESLIEWVHRVKPDIRLLLWACERLAWAVERLHERVGRHDDVMLHRDLKPTNVLVRDTTDGLQVVLADLGLTREAAGLATIGDTGLFTASYGAPEQVIPGMRVVGSAVDVHALAATIFHVLTGRSRRAFSPTDFTPRFLHLTALHRQEDRTPSEQAEMEDLARSPIEQLLRLERAPALGHEDHEHLERAWTTRLTDLRLPPSVARETLRELVDVLEHALEPRPRRRLTEARVVRQTLASVRVRLEQAVADRKEAPASSAWIAAPVEAGSADLVGPAPGGEGPASVPAARPPTQVFPPAGATPVIDPEGPAQPRRRPAGPPPVWAPLVPLVPLLVGAGVALALFAEGGLRLARRAPAGEDAARQGEAPPALVLPADEAAPAPDVVATRRKTTRQPAASPVDTETPALAVSSIQVTVVSTDHEDATLKRAGREGPDGARGAFYVGATPVPVELVGPSAEGTAPGSPLASLVLRVRRTGAVSSLYVRRDGVDLPPEAIPDGAAAVVRCGATGCATTPSGP